MNLRFLARQLTNVVVTTVGHINDDRVFFGMQLARRLPGPASRFVGHALGRLPGDASRAASAWLLGRRDDGEVIGLRFSLAVTPSRRDRTQSGTPRRSRIDRRCCSRRLRTELTYRVDQGTHRRSHRNSARRRTPDTTDR